jgi:hypothetical protein
LLLLALKENPSTQLVQWEAELQVLHLDELGHAEHFRFGSW